jgi:nucleoside-triphosphatase THEP1
MEIYKPLNDTIYWKNKYAPKTIDDLEIDKSLIYNISNWFKNYNKNKAQYAVNTEVKSKKKFDIDDTEFIQDDQQGEDLGDLGDNIDFTTKEKILNSPNKSCLMITGNHGVGKTSIITTILQSLDYTIYQINFNKINFFKTIEEFIQKPIFNNSINEKINNTNNKKKVILIDNIESILYVNHKKFLMKLAKYNDTYWDIPIVMVSNNKHNKLVYFIKKFSYEIHIPNPNKYIMENILCKISMNENINIGDEKLIDKIIEYSSYDIRSLVNNLQSLKNIYGEKYINFDDFNTFIITSKMKDNDPDIFNATHKLFYGYDNIDNVIRLFETEKTVMPLMIQQHYIDYLKNANIDTINKISKTIAFGDILENYIYDTNIYDIRDIQSFYQCVYPSYLLTNKLNPKKQDINNFSSSFTYPKDLNKTSIRFINYTKNIYQSNKIFNNMSIEDYLYFNKIFKNIIKSNDYKVCSDYLDKYNCNISNIETVLKIDKIDENKFTLSTKVKKKIINECENIFDKSTKDVDIKKLKKSKKKQEK